MVVPTVVVLIALLASVVVEAPPMLPALVVVVTVFPPLVVVTVFPPLVVVGLVVVVTVFPPLVVVGLVVVVVVAAHVLSVEAVPFTRIVPHSVQFVQAFKLIAFVNLPFPHGVQTRLLLDDPGVDTKEPALQSIHCMHEFSFVEVVNIWALQGVHSLLPVFVPLVETYFPAAQDVHAVHDEGTRGGKEDSLTSCMFLNSPSEHSLTFKPHSTPNFVFVLAVHVPAKGDVVHGFALQSLVVMYLLVPCDESEASYP